MGPSGLHYGIGVGFHAASGSLADRWSRMTTKTSDRVGDVKR